MAVTQLKRGFLGSDPYMVEQSDICKALLENNLADFTNFDGTINAGFVTAFAAKINAAFTVVKDSAVLSPQLTATETVMAIMQQGREAYTDLMYFVSKKAFKTNKLVIKEFNAIQYSQSFTAHIYCIFRNPTYYRRKVQNHTTSQWLQANINR